MYHVRCMSVYVIVCAFVCHISRSTHLNLFRIEHFIGSTLLVLSRMLSVGRVALLVALLLAACSVVLLCGSVSFCVPCRGPRPLKGKARELGRSR